MEEIRTYGDLDQVLRPRVGREIRFQAGEWAIEMKSRGVGVGLIVGVVWDWAVRRRGETPPGCPVAVSGRGLPDAPNLALKRQMLREAEAMDIRHRKWAR
ncbi:hypothetical protein [Azospirillum sp. TSO22-1]|uniref:hypothetical protein n=1 Tax=Azospirillum sp. TSO22-1 TaxID=716789 RepID=UPI000D61BB5E|nr:hypothetical protein [Azospirillum sp. TSO22-1]PWC45873.1 hypothetical protein TSO221_15070 [Azospirillum sp. TSO22-1]